ncbi:T9SS type A sorting domain-containing protein [Winogradskyella alexanderae]|uniref:T9SS type A sorting domain-containing protein n=1 Tax=Winogradskyella alexanderae TaxID=2877123 RepID=A0ABS7XNG7_9FLAO|nr:T9SS type A sorting domain-containing protein [Winogradskyella alexanderae]MCA0131548.1 T9SS type A sorting domain-containing protein [Winogradskyella alexanderae]
MKKLYFLLFSLLLLCSLSFGQTTVFQESFETDGNGSRYTTSQVEFSDGFGDFFGRTNLNDTAEDAADLIVGNIYTLSGTDGDFCFAGMDLDAANATGSGGSATQTLEITGININGFSNLSLAILLAEDDDGTNQDWDETDNLIIEVQVDAGGYTPIIAVEGTGASNSEPAIDSDFDGTGDGTAITSTFQEFVASISSGTILDIRLTFTFNSGDEDIAVDNIRVVDGFAASPNITAGPDVAGLNYEFNAGPSAEGSFTVEGADLTDDITVTPPTNYEISTTSGSGYVTTPIVLTQTGGTVASTTIYTRLISGLAIGNYNEDVLVTSPGATDRTVSLSGSVFAALTNALKISGVFDVLTNGSPKGIEIEVLSDIADLSIFGVGSANNGGGTDGEEFTFPAVSALTGDLLYIVGSGQSADFNTFFGVSLTPYESSAAFINGDDAIELFENGQVIDVFGDINVDGTGEPWDYVDGWAYRNVGTGPDGSTFVLANWSFSGTGQLDGTLNNNSTSPYPSGNLLSITEEFIFDFSIYPNPTNTGSVTITSTTSQAIDVQVFDVLGKQVINQRITNNNLNVSNLKSGLYIVRIMQNNASVTKKLVIK